MLIDCGQKVRGVDEGGKVIGIACREKKYDRLRFNQIAFLGQASMDCTAYPSVVNAVKLPLDQAGEVPSSRNDNNPGGV